MCISTFAATQYVCYVCTYVCICILYLRCRYVCTFVYVFIIIVWIYVHMSIHTCVCLAEKNIRPLHKDCTLNICRLRNYYNYVRTYLPGPGNHFDCSLPLLHTNTCTIHPYVHMYILVVFVCVFIFTQQKISRLCYIRGWYVRTYAHYHIHTNIYIT